jgi:hypothetical protein
MPTLYDIINFGALSTTLEAHDELMNDFNGSFKRKLKIPSPTFFCNQYIAKWIFSIHQRIVSEEKLSKSVREQPLSKMIKDLEFGGPFDEECHTFFSRGAQDLVNYYDDDSDSDSRGIQTVPLDYSDRESEDEEQVGYVSPMHFEPFTSDYENDEHSLVWSSESESEEEKSLEESNVINITITKDNLKSDDEDLPILDSSIFEEWEKSDSEDIKKSSVKRKLNSKSESSQKKKKL